MTHTTSSVSPRRHQTLRGLVTIGLLLLLFPLPHGAAQDAPADLPTPEEVRTVVLDQCMIYLDLSPTGGASVREGAFEGYAACALRALASIRYVERLAAPCQTEENESDAVAFFTCLGANVIHQGLEGQTWGLSSLCEVDTKDVYKTGCDLTTYCLACPSFTLGDGLDEACDKLLRICLDQAIGVKHVKSEVTDDECDGIKAEAKAGSTTKITGVNAGFFYYWKISTRAAVTVSVDWSVECHGTADITGWAWGGVARELVINPTSEDGTGAFVCKYDGLVSPDCQGTYSGKTAYAEGGYYNAKKKTGDKPPKVVDLAVGAYVWENQFQGSLKAISTLDPDTVASIPLSHPVTVIYGGGGSDTPSKPKATSR